jgi:O-antigen/teichoic acid export membrane protein
VRFLHPEKYGLMAMTMAIAGFVQSFSYAGFLEAVIQRRDIDEAKLRSIFALIWVVNGACLVTLYILACPAADFHGEPRLIPLTVPRSLLMAVTGRAFTDQPQQLWPSYQKHPSSVSTRSA